MRANVRVARETCLRRKRRGIGRRRTNGRETERVQKCKKKEEERGKETRCGENKRKRNSEREELLRNGIVAFDVCKGYLWIRERARARTQRCVSDLMFYIE